MGYDMRLVDPPEKLAERKARYDAAYDELRKYERGTSEYESAREVWLKLEDPTYFRLNIFGMSRYRDIMDEIGMLSWAQRQPEFPTPDDPRLKGIDVNTDEGYEQYREVVKHTTTGLESFGVIPGYKLCSNDGWHVTASECAQAVEAWEQYGENDGGTGHVYAKELIGDDEWGYWLQWIAYLRLGAEGNGFEVW